MKLTTEQLEQCRREFEAWNEKGYLDDEIEFADSICDDDREPDKWNRALSYYAAWRLRLSVDEIEKIIDSFAHKIDYQGGIGFFDSDSEKIAQAIYRAQGGEDE